ncbi:uncharacterized protein LOC110112299 isoform X2 [Dendrobium catenatum]|uniref:uncharacterized protein LOC110112299 isoform X2 n=1 Tax=Dendrobium catenatum TaxID=906689 RepID=UPI00109FAD24|nr:uncharacterized protein LOC110112299 isoform X2 [Dendrobium catenatum]
MSKIHISDESSVDLDTNDQEFTFSWGPLFSSSRDYQKPNQKMSGKLVFNINITAAQSAESNQIRFGSEFDKLQATFGAPQPEVVAPPVESDKSTPIQVNVEGGSAAAKPSIFTRLTYPQSAAMAKEKSPVVGIPSLWEL